MQNKGSRPNSGRCKTLLCHAPRNGHSLASIRFVWLTLLLTFGCSTRQNTSCLEPGRRSECELTLEFDATTEQFTSIEAKDIENAVKDTTDLPWTGKRPFPVLTGDMLNVRIANAVYGEIITASAVGVERTPFPRPGISGELSLASMVIKSLAGPRLEPLPTKDQGLAGVSPLELLKTPQTFMARWNAQVKAPLDEFAKVRAEFAALDSAAMQLERQSKMLHSAHDEVIGMVNTLRVAVENAAESIRHECGLAPQAVTKAAGNGNGGLSGTNGSGAIHIEDGKCLGVLYDASRLQARQEGLHRVVQQLLASIDVSTAQATITRIEKVFAQPAVKRILSVDLDVALRMSSHGGQVRSPRDTPRQSDAAVRADLARTGALTAIPNVVHALQEKKTAELAALVDRIRTIHGDSAALQDYQSTRHALLDVHGAVPAITQTINEVRTDFDPAYMELALAMADLAFTFDQASARPMAKHVTVPVFRSANDETITIKLVRSARFAPAPAWSILPVKGEANSKAANGTEAQATLQREYSFELAGRSREYFQVAAGFLFSGVRSSTFGTREEVRRVQLPGESEPRDVTHRFITETEERARKLAPAALLVYHVFGKDVHPDAYRSLRMLVPGFAIGTTLDHPLDNFTVGPTWEFLPGLHVSAGFHTTQVQKLQDGFQTGSEIPAGSSAPTRNARKNSWYFAGMLDANVFADFFGKLFK